MNVLQKCGKSVFGKTPPDFQMVFVPLPHSHHFCLSWQIWAEKSSYTFLAEDLQFFLIWWRPIGQYFGLWKLVACWWQVYNCRPAAPSPLCPVGAFIQSSWNWLQLAFRLGQTYIGFVYTENTIDNNSKWYVLCHFQTGPLYVQVGILESEQFRQ